MPRVRWSPRLGMVIRRLRWRDRFGPQTLQSKPLMLIGWRDVVAAQDPWLHSRCRLALTVRSHAACPGDQHDCPTIAHGYGGERGHRHCPFCLCDRVLWSDRVVRASSDWQGSIGLVLLIATFIR